MRYEPAFLEVFVVWTLSVLWSFWLRSRGASTLFDWLPWVGGFAVLVGQVAAALTVLGGSLEPDPARTWMILLARWGPLTVVLGVIAIELAGTIERLVYAKNTERAG